MNTLGQRLHWARDVAGVTTRELAGAAEVARGYPSAVELGQVPNPGVESVRKIAEALQIDPVWLIFGTGAPPSEHKLKRRGRELKGAA